MQSWLGLNLDKITPEQFLYLAYLWVISWFVCHFWSMAANKLVEKIVFMRKPDNSNPLKRPHKQIQAEMPKELTPGDFHVLQEYLYLLLIPFVLKPKSKLAIAALTTWAMAKFHVLA